MNTGVPGSVWSTRVHRRCFLHGAGEEWGRCPSQPTTRHAGFPFRNGNFAANGYRLRICKAELHPARGEHASSRAPFPIRVCRGTWYAGLELSRVGTSVRDAVGIGGGTPRWGDHSQLFPRCPDIGSSELRTRTPAEGGVLQF